MNGRDRIINALKLKPVDRTPVWFMRQAGRHLPEYRKIAANHSFWERCKDTELCTEITLQPIKRYKTQEDICQNIEKLLRIIHFGKDAKIPNYVLKSHFNQSKDTKLWMLPLFSVIFLHLYLV